MTLLLELIAAGLVSAVAGGFVYGLTTLLASRRDIGRRLSPAGDAPAPPVVFRAGTRLLRSLPPSVSQSLVDRWGRDFSDGPVAVGETVIHAEAYVGLRLLLGLSGFVAGCLALGPGGSGLVVGVGLGLAAQSAAAAWMRQKIQADRAELAALIPDLIDILAIGIEAGLTFDKAVGLYCERFTNSLGRLFSDFLAQLAIGKPRRQAFADLIKQCRVDEVVWLGNSVLQADKLGVPLAQALKNQAIAARARQHEKIRELAATAPIKMLFPIAGLILPSLLIVLMGPAFMRFLN